MSTAAAEYISESAEARVESCGQPIRIARASGDVEWSTWCCEHRACDSCQRIYSARVTQCIEATLEDAPELTHLTLTQRPWQRGLIARDGQACERALRDHWSAAVDLAREMRRANRKMEEWEKRKDADYGDLPKALGDYWYDYWDAKQNRLARTLRDAVGGDWHQRAFTEGTDELTYLWQKECEVSVDAGHYHWHYHVATPDRETAELLNAAWQVTRTQPDTCQTTIQTREGDAEDLGEELGQYLSGTRSGAFLDGAETWQVAAFFIQLRDVRLYGAAGEWRPIGVRPDSDDENPVVAVAWANSSKWFTWEEWWTAGREAVEIAGTHGIQCVPIELRFEEPDHVDNTAHRLLEQGTNNFSDPFHPAAVSNEGLDPPNDLSDYVEALGDPDA